MVRLDNIRAEMARNRMKQSDLAKLLGLAKSTTWMKLNSKIPFSIEELVKISQIFDKNIEFFLN